ncbi:hypothetical protein GCM10023094_51760 [Rhodococcus olei]|uniref:AMP-binding enzyme n=1 Tax=Rhodococcus olei TaxID=2161675 RepID=A0ABP8PQP2_9NOCA
MLQAENPRVVDENMVDVPADGESMGEIVLRGHNVMLGYFRDPEATAQAFACGWFHTGDLGVMHPDGYIHGSQVRVAGAAARAAPGAEVGAGTR